MTTNLSQREVMSLVGSNTVDAVLPGQEIPFATPGKDDVGGGYGGLGMEFRHASVAVYLSGASISD